MVSADGHPIEGAFTFTVAAPAEAGPAPATTAPAPTAEPTASATPREGVTALPEDAEGDGGAGSLLWGIGLMALALVVLLGVVLRARRR